MTLPRFRVGVKGLARAVAGAEVDRARPQLVGATQGWAGACHCVRRRVWPKANAEREESMFQQAAAQGTQCEARSRSLPGRRTRWDVGRRFALRALGGALLDNRLAMKAVRSSQYASPHTGARVAEPPVYELMAMPPSMGIVACGGAWPLPVPLVGFT
jgi:hypothetical protein